MAVSIQPVNSIVKKTACIRTQLNIVRDEACIGTVLIDFIVQVWRWMLHVDFIVINRIYVLRLQQDDIEQADTSFSDIRSFSWFSMPRQNGLSIMFAVVVLDRDEIITNESVTRQEKQSEKKSGWTPRRRYRHRSYFLSFIIQWLKYKKKQWSTLVCVLRAMEFILWNNSFWKKWTRKRKRTNAKSRQSCHRRVIFSDPYTAKLSDKSIFPFMTDQ
jgi:hypothetical protein